MAIAPSLKARWNWFKNNHGHWLLGGLLVIALVTGASMFLWNSWTRPTQHVTQTQFHDLHSGTGKGNRDRRLTSGVVMRAADAVQSTPTNDLRKRVGGDELSAPKHATVFQGYALNSGYKAGTQADPADLSCALDSRHAFYWRHYGAAKFAQTNEEAMANREAAFRCFAKFGIIPESTVAQLASITGTTGEDAEIHNGDSFTASISRDHDGPIVVHRNVHVAFDNPPEHGMAFAAKALVWHLAVGDLLIEVSKAEVCGNWSVRVTHKVRPHRVVALATAAPHESCYDLEYNAPVGGYTSWFIISDDGPVLPSDCNAQWQDDGPKVAWYGDCPDCNPSLAPIENVLSSNAPIVHRHRFKHEGERQHIGFDSSIRTKAIAICVVYPDRHEMRTVYVTPEDWAHKHHVPIPDSDFIDSGKHSRRF